MAIFNTGDIVRCIRNKDALSNGDGKGAGWEKGLEFKILSVHNYDPYNCYFGGVNQNGVYEPYLEPVSSSKKMNKLTAKIKRIFNPDLQTQYRAGLIDDRGDITDKGRDEFEEMLRAKFNSEFTEAAQTIIDEEKKDKK